MFVTCWSLTGNSSAQDIANNRDQAKQRILQLLNLLHERDAAIANKAEAELRRLGVSEEQLRWGRMLVHPDPSQRARLARSVAAVEQETRREILLQLTADSHPNVRSAALQAIRSTSPGIKLKRRVFDMAKSDTDSVVQEDARSLCDVWNGTTQKNIAGQSGGNVASESGSDVRTVPVAPNPSKHHPDQHPTEIVTAENPEKLVSRRLATEPVQNQSEDQHRNRNQNQNTSPRPNILRRPDRPPLEPPFAEQVTPYNYDQSEPLLLPEVEAPFGFTGPSGILPTETQQNSHFAPIEDRWRTGFPAWDRYGTGHPGQDDYPGVEGHWWDPYNQNVLKGDYPIIGQHTFLNITATSLSLFEYREVPTATTPFESTFNPFEEEFFGDPGQFFLTQFYKVRFDLFHGNQAAFKPLDWQIRLTPVFNMNYLDVGELAIVNPDVRHGTTRFRDDVALEEWFVEAKLADLSPNYDFMSVRAGSQFFTSDFRGFIFSDTNRAVRLFGTKFSNRDQFNIIWFDQQEKETNSQLNTFDDRHQNVLIANYYRQDFLIPGYTAQLSFHYNRDRPSFKFDENDFLVRPDPAGVFQPHSVETYYFGIAGDGHIRRINVNNHFYFVTGRDSLNPIGGRELDINAKMAALELSYDRDWARFRTSFFWASGDDDVTDDKGEGFDSIFDNPNFAGGEFSYWQRQPIQLFGVRLVNDKSIVPDLRASKIQGQSNFTNPGLFLFNVGVDADITPKLKAIANANYLYFDKTESLEVFTFQDKIDHEIGFDLSLGMEYRPFHNDNMIVLFGFAALLPGDGFKDLYNEFNDTAEPMHAGFLEVFLTY